MSISQFSLLQRNNGFWYILFKDEGRIRWKSTGASRQGEAVASLTNFKKLLAKTHKSVLFSKFIPEISNHIEQNRCYMKVL